MLSFRYSFGQKRMCKLSTRLYSQPISSAQHAALQGVLLLPWRAQGPDTPSNWEANRPVPGRALALSLRVTGGTCGTEPLSPPASPQLYRTRLSAPPLIRACNPEAEPLSLPTTQMGERSLVFQQSIKCKSQTVQRLSERAGRWTAGEQFGTLGG